MAVTETERKENTRLMTLYISIVIGILGGYVIGYAGGLMARDYLSFTDALRNAVAGIMEGTLLPPLNGSAFLAFFISGGLIGGAMFFFMSIDNQKRYHHKADEVGGTGGFMSKKEMRQYAERYITPDPPPIKTGLPVAYDPEKDQEMYSQNMILSKHFCRPIDSRALIGNNNLLIVGGAGTGKSRYVIKPNILQMNASYVITDPSGEMLVSLGHTLRDHGYKIKIFNISDMRHSNRYNPLNYIRDEAGVKMLIECLISNTTKGEGGGDNQFFVDAEQLLYSACIFYLTQHCHDYSRKNFAEVINLINKSSVNELDPNAKSDLDKMFDELDHSSLAWKYYRSFKQAAGKTLKSIIISCVTRLQPFLIPQVINLTKTDDLELNKLGEEKTALFIITPQADRTYSFLASMLYSQLFETLYHIGEQQKATTGDERLRIPVRCLMDEFANIGEVPNFPSRLSTMRKYNISATVVLQNIAQIEAMYEDDWKTLVGNCSTLVFLGSQEPEVLKYFSEMLGKTTIRVRSEGLSSGGKSGSSQNYQSTGREVLTAEELGRLPSDECIIYTQNMRPVRDKKYVYEEHPYYDQTGDADSSLNFPFLSMSVYDNARNELVEGLIRAKMEVARYRKSRQKGVTTISLDKPVAPESVMETLDRQELSSAEKKRLLTTSVEEAVMLAAGCGRDPIRIALVENIPYGLLSRVSDITAKRLLLPGVLVFTGWDDRLLIGCIFDREKRGYYQALSNEYVKKISSTNGVVCVAINRSDFTEYREFVNGSLRGTTT